MTAPQERPVAGDGLDREAIGRRAEATTYDDEFGIAIDPCEHASATGTDSTPIGPGKRWRCDACGAEWVDQHASAEDVPALLAALRAAEAEVERLRAAYEDLSDAVAGPPGGTCTQVEAMSDTEWVRRHWRNAIDQWKWWRAEAEHLAGPQPVSLVIRARNWEARARDAEARLRTEGGAS